MMIKKMVYWFFMAVLVGDLAYAVPHQIRFQGRLTDHNGIPIVGTPLVAFSLNDHELGGRSLWSSGPSTVTTNTAGIFSVDLNVSPPTVFSDYQDVWLEITVYATGGPKRLTPRQKIVSVPFSMQADRAQSALLADGVQNDAITSSKIKDGTIENTDLGENSVGSIQILNYSVSSVDLAPDSVTSDKIKDGSVQKVDLSTSAISSENILDGSVHDVDIASGAVSQKHIAAGYGLLPAGAIILWTGVECPAGFRRFGALDGLFPMGAPAYSPVTRGSDSIGGLVVVSSGAHSHKVDAHEHSIAMDEPQTSEEGAHQHASPLALQAGGGIGAYFVSGKTYDVRPQTGPFGLSSQGLSVADPITAYTFAAFTPQGIGDYQWALTDSSGTHSHKVIAHDHKGVTGSTSPLTNIQPDHSHVIEPKPWRPPYLEILFCERAWED